eukprot:CAMPEP_0194273186 /NCGR_PEP_ID=MMETSP0169-20130528/6583_1 /TAXON_ID=218684 /ORGANISM="Corethron pennatum, Strain L29A3" /LENGTH=521 /DNA_ID=CAMNT_0039016065 /DNA_START=121 /DNA_END=1686 /DNA_ORIENTATION=-
MLRCGNLLSSSVVSKGQQTSTTLRLRGCLTRKIDYDPFFLSRRFRAHCHQSVERLACRPNCLRRPDALPPNVRSIHGGGGSCRGNRLRRGSPLRRRTEVKKLKHPSVTTKACPSTAETVYKAQEAAQEKARSVGQDLERIASSAAQQVHQATAAATAQYSKADLRRIVGDALFQRTLKFWAGVAAFLVGSYGLVAVVYPQEARVAIASELSDVASRSLADERMQDQAAETVRALVSDEGTVRRAAEFVQKVAADEGTRQALADLLARALKDPAVMGQALDLVHWILQNPAARENLVGTLMAALQNETFVAAAGDFAVVWLGRPEVLKIVTDVLRDASLKVLEDQTIREDAAVFLRELLQEPMLQAKTGEHLWSAVKGVVLPGWRRKLQREPRLPTAEELLMNKELGGNKADAEKNKSTPTPVHDKTLDNNSISRMDETKLSSRKETKFTPKKEKEPPQDRIDLEQMKNNEIIPEKEITIETTTTEANNVKTDSSATEEIKEGTQEGDSLGPAPHSNDVVLA